MNSKDIKTIFSILGPDVTRITYVKGGYKVAIVAPAKEEAKPSATKEVSVIRAGGGEGYYSRYTDKSRYAQLQAAFATYGNNHNYELTVISSNLSVRQHDLSGCTHKFLIRELDTLEIAWCKNVGIRIQ
jgi:hypothetical protein